MISTHWCQITYYSYSQPLNLPTLSEFAKSSLRPPVLSFMLSLFKGKIRKFNERKIV